MSGRESKCGRESVWESECDRVSVSACVGECVCVRE